MPMELSREKAVQAWGTPKNCDKPIDIDLAESFAEILNGIWSKPWLGNATTDELLSEIRARIEMDGKLYYRTSDDE